jgi:cell division protease FtsH
VHTRSIPLAPAVDLGRIAATTPGMVGADLANLANEAALLAARRNHKLVDESDFTDALERIVLGAERQVMMDDEDRRRTAYHEGGHAIVGMSTGAESDIQQLTEIARQMVGRWGMSAAVGPIAVIPRDGGGPLLPGAAEVSSDTQRLVDEEVRRIVDESHEEVVALLQQNRSKLDSLAAALLKAETLDEEAAYAAAGVPRTATPGADPYAAAARSRSDR